MGAGVWLVILWGVGAGGSLFEGFACLLLVCGSLWMFLACGVGASLSLIVAEFLVDQVII